MPPSITLRSRSHGLGRVAGAEIPANEANMPARAQRSARSRGVAAMGGAAAAATPSVGHSEPAARDSHSRRALLRAATNQSQGSSSGSELRASSSPAAAPPVSTPDADGTGSPNDRRWAGTSGWHGTVLGSWARAKWAWHVYASTCGVLGIAYALCQLRAKLFALVSSLALLSAGAIYWRRKTFWQQMEAVHVSQQRALLEAEARSQELAEQARAYETRLDAQWAELQRLREANTSVCKICFDRVSGCALLPCKHHAFCTPCAYQLMEGQRDARCPLCRTPIAGIFETFVS